METVILSRQAVQDIKEYRSHLFSRLGRSANDYIESVEDELILAFDDTRFQNRYKEYRSAEVFVYRTPKGRQNYYYRIVGQRVELLHTSGDALSHDNVINAIDNGITNGHSGHSISSL